MRGSCSANKFWSMPILLESPENLYLRLMNFKIRVDAYQYVLLQAKLAADCVEAMRLSHRFKVYGADALRNAPA